MPPTSFLKAQETKLPSHAFKVAREQWSALVLSSL